VCSGTGFKEVQYSADVVRLEPGEIWFPRSAKGRMNAALSDMGYSTKEGSGGKRKKSQKARKRKRSADVSSRKSGSKNT
jgi:hypothetical protein